MLSGSLDAVMLFVRLFNWIVVLTVGVGDALKNSIVVGMCINSSKEATLNPFTNALLLSILETTTNQRR